MLNVQNKFMSAALVLSAVLASPMAFSAVIKTEIIKVEAPAHAGDKYSVLSTQDGRVYTANPADQKLIRSLKAFSAKRTPINLILADNEVVGVEKMSSAEASEYVDAVTGIGSGELLNSIAGTDAPVADADQKSVEMDTDTSADIAAPQGEPAAITEVKRYGYSPTIYSSMSQAHQLFESERPLNHDSQCHERAMVWTYDMYRNYGTMSMKVMMFYTERFRNTYRRKTEHWYGDATYEPYKWWYHTAPFVYVGNQEVVLDREFCDTEKTLDNWTSFFLAEEVFLFSNVGAPTLTADETHCRVMNRYQDYNNPGSDWCMVRKYPMYYMQPNSVESMDCDPSKDVASGKPNTRLNDGRIKYPCLRRTLGGFDQKFLDTAYSHATERKPDWNTGR